MFILLSWPPLQPCLVCFPIRHLHVHPLRTCLHYTRKLFVSTRSAIRYSMSSNGPDQEQVLHTHRMSRRNIWPKGFGARPNPYKSEYLFTLHLSVAQIASATNSSGTFWFFFFFCFCFWFWEVLHTHRISCRSVWTRVLVHVPVVTLEFFTSVSVGSSPCSYLITSAKVRIPVHSALKCGTNNLNHKFLGNFLTTFAVWRSLWFCKTS